MSSFERQEVVLKKIKVKRIEVWSGVPKKI